MGIILFRMCGISEETIRSVPKGKKRFHDLCFDEDILDPLKGKYSQKLLDLGSKMTSFDFKERLSLDDTIGLYNEI